MAGVVFHEGADTAHIVDEIKGGQPVMYRFKAGKGQSLVVEQRPKDQNTEFVLFAPGKWPGTELHDSAARSSRQYSGQVNRDGMHAVLVSRSAGADKGESARFDLTITLKKAAKQVAPAVFTRKAYKDSSMKPCGCFRFARLAENRRCPHKNQSLQFFCC